MCRMAVTLSAPVLMVSFLLLELAGGKDLYWQPNSNWGSPDNWALGRIPACGDRVSFASVREGVWIYRTLGVDCLVLAGGVYCC